uniref:Uncharacterized protein n=1 Tax=Arundo donax TaxID=35708 RepID=A0A0A9DZT3_ARUDO
MWGRQKRNLDLKLKHRNLVCLLGLLCGRDTQVNISSLAPFFYSVNLHSLWKILKAARTSIYAAFSTSCSSWFLY